MVMPSSEYKFTPMQLKWLEALESGEYKQGIGHLHQEGKYCCLGVGASVCGVPDEAMGKKGELDGDLAEVVEMLGLRGPCGNFDDPYKLKSGEVDEELEDALEFIYSLVDPNDELDWDFKQIAQFIRENPELVFVDAAEQ
jgi:hypothetical protein